MAELGARTRSTLRIPRVEFDLSGLLLGMAGYLAYTWSWVPLASLLGVARHPLPQGQFVEGAIQLKAEFFAKVISVLRLPWTDWVATHVGWRPIPVPAGEDRIGMALDPPWLELPWWQHGVVVLWMLILWSLVGGGLARIHAVRIARDESVPVFEALGFSLENLRSFLMAPLFIVAAGGFFLLLNVLAGAASAIPVAGAVIEIVALALALLSGLVLAVIVIGGVFGLPLLHAALATERNGTLDAISRTFSYLFTRPVMFFAGAAIVLFVSGLLGQFGMWFVDLTGRTVALGAFFDEGVQGDIAQGVRHGMLLSWLPGAEGDPASFHLWVSWAWSFLATLAVRGFVLSYVVGGLTDVYFMLRGEVDGIDDAEVFLEGETASLGDPLPGEPQDPPA